MLPPPSSDSLSSTSTASLHEQVNPFSSTTGSRAVFTNWASTFASKTRATFRPTSVADVRRVVELARREGIELRPSGSGHSPSDLVCTEGYVVNLDGLDRVLEVSPFYLTPSFPLGWVEGQVRVREQCDREAI